MATEERAGVGKLASAFEKATLPPAESAVSSIASKFDAAEKSRQQGKISSKISSVADVFEVKKPSSQAKRTPSASPTVVESAKANALTSTVRSNNAGFSEAAKVFQRSESASRQEKEKEKENEPQSAFKTASATFMERENNSSPPADTKVSAFAQKLDQAAKASSESPLPKLRKQPSNAASTPVKTVPKDGSKLEDKKASPGASVAKASAVLDSNVSDKTESAKFSKDQSSAIHRFKEAAAKFDNTGCSTTDGKGDVDAAAQTSSRFADASKVFGGSLK